MIQANATNNSAFDNFGKVVASSNYIHAVSELNGFKKGDRIAVTDVVACPPQVYNGKIEDVFSDGLAQVSFDYELTPAADRNIKNNGRVNLHWAVHA